MVEGKLLEDEGPAAGADAGDGPTVEVSGVLELTRQRYGFVRLTGLAPDPEDVYISAAQVRRCELRQGDEVVGPAREPRRGERHRALVHVDAVNGEEPQTKARQAFDDLPPILPERRIPLDDARDDVLIRAVDLLAPLAFGQRALVRAAPRAGRTTLLRGIAQAAAKAGARVVVLLIDERPEEATAWREAVSDAEFAIATADFAPTEQVRIAELALERSRRIAESGADAVLLCDSLSRLAFAAGGVDEVKRLFGSGRNLAGGGSLSVVATTLDGAHDEGAAERAVITTESALVVLDPELAGLGVTPAIAPGECRVSNEDDLREAGELDAVRRLRSLLADLEPRRPRTTCASGSRAPPRIRSCFAASSAGCSASRPLPSLSAGLRLAPVGETGPGGLARELDRLRVAIRLHVAEGVRVGVEDDVELTLLDPLVEPGAAEDEAPDPMHEAAVGGADELGPVRVDVLAQGRGGLADLAVHGQLEQVVELLVLEPLVDEVELHRGLFDALGEVLLVEGEAELAVLEDVVGARFVISSASCLLHGSFSDSDRFRPVREGRPQVTGILADFLGARRGKLAS